MNDVISIKQGETLLLRLTSDGELNIDTTDFKAGYTGDKGIRGTFEIVKSANSVDILLPANITDKLNYITYAADIFATHSGITSCIASFLFKVEKSNI